MACFLLILNSICNSYLVSNPFLFFIFKVGLSFSIFFFRKNSLTRMIRPILKFMTSRPGKQTITIHLLPNISQIKGNQTMKFDQFPAGTRCPGDVPWRSPKGPYARDLQGTLSGPTEKLMVLSKKVFFRCSSLCFTHSLLFLTGKTNIQKLYMGMSTGRLRDPVTGRAGDQIMGLSGDVRGTFVMYVL